MEWLPKCAKLEMAVGSQNWLGMMVVYCRNAAKEDREFATRVNRMRGDMIVACEDRETMDTDDMRIGLLHDLEKEAEERAREKECGALRDAVGGWDWPRMMVLYCQKSAEDDRSFARRLNDLLQEMESAYDEKVNFIRELEAVSGVDAVAKTTDFLNENLWKDDKWVRKLRSIEMNANLLAFEKERFIEKL
ncbi:hypothetical protein Tco_0427641 [Tanacetum coccineum]